MLADEEIRDAALAEKDPKKLCEKLVELANEKGGVDNVTVVVVSIPQDAGPS
jgi:serine/threonine protein phosphatase PrpC